MTRREPLCKRALTVLRKREMQQKVSRKQIAFSTAHIAKCPNCLADSAMIREMIATRRDRAFDELSARREADAILARLSVGDQGAAKTPMTNPKLTWAALGTAVASVVAGLTFGLLSLASTEDGKAGDSRAVSIAFAPDARPSGDGHPRGGTSPAPVEPPVLPSAAPGDSPPRTMDTHPVNRPSLPIIKTGAVSQEVLLGDGIRLLVRPESDVTLTQSDRVAVSVALHRGHVVVFVEPSGGGPSVSVQTTAMRVTVTGTVFAVRAEGEGGAHQVCVLRGTVHVTEPNGAFHTVGRGERLSPGMSKPSRAVPEQLAAISRDADRLTAIDATRRGYVDWRPEMGRIASAVDIPAVDRSSVGIEPAAKRRAPPSSVDLASSTTIREILLDARRYRLARQWSKLAETYRHLIDRYPNRPETASALVALGEVQLRHMKQPRAALFLFDKYIRTGERTILEEAFIGKADALRAMGRTAEERAVLLDFVDRFPHSIHVPTAKQRLAALEAR